MNEEDVGSEKGQESCKQHDWRGGVVGYCNKCGKECEHPLYRDELCEVCGSMY